VLMIRLARVGARKQPYYRVVVIEKDRARNGRSVEVIGTYNPRTSPATVDLKQDRIEYWTKNGAQLSDRMAKLVKNYKPRTEGEPTPDKKTSRKGVAKVEPKAAEHKAAEPTAAAAEPETAPEAPAPDNTEPDNSEPAAAA
jgi:small subunit ribosomal protein S16